MHQCANRYSFLQETCVHILISSLMISKLSLLIGLRARWLSKCGVPWIRVRTAGPSGSTHELSLMAFILLESLSEGWTKGSWCSSWTNWHRIVLCSIAKPSSGRCSADEDMSFCWECNGREWCQRQCTSVSSSSQDTVDECPCFGSKKICRNNVKKCLRGPFSTHSIGSQLVIGKSHTGI